MSQAAGQVTGTVTIGQGAGAAASPRPGGGRAGIVLVLVAVLVGGLATLGALVATPTPPEGVTYVPPGSVAVMEIRPDLPGDQREALGALLLRVPGFADVASLNDRINRAFDDTTRRATDGKTAFADVRPYAAGAAILAVLPPVGTAAAGGDAAAPRGLGVLATDGSVGCGPFEAGRGVTTERYRDVELRTFAPASTTDKGHRDGVEACAVSGKFVLLGDPAAIRAGLDSRALNRNVSGDVGYGAAFRALAGQHAAWGYVNGRVAAALASSLPRPSGATAASSARPSPAVSVDPPEWAAMEVRFTASAMVVESVMPDRRAEMLAALPVASGKPRTPAPAVASTLAPLLPASTIALLEAHDTATLLAAATSGGGAGATLPGASPLSSLAPSLGSALATFGAAGNLLGGVGQASAVVVRNGATSAAGMVVEIADPTAATAALDQLRLLGGLLGGVTATEYHGARILSVPVATLSKLAGVAGAGGPGALPQASSLPAGSTLSIAVHDRLLVIGLGDGLARAVIDTAPGASLADQAAYRTAIGNAGTPNLGSLYLDLAALRAAGPGLQPLASAAPRASANPFTEAFGVAAGSLTSADGLLRGRLVISVR